MKLVLLILLYASFMLSCNWAKDKTKDTLNKGGEIVGKAGAEVAEGIGKGVTETFSVTVEASPRLRLNGVTIGRTTISGTDSSTDNVLSAYLIFDRKFSGKITAKAIDASRLEFGRVANVIAADSGQAKFVDFIFDRRTNIDRKDRITLE